MEKEFVTYELALKLKELGYSQITIENQNRNILAYFYDGMFILNGRSRHRTSFDENLAVSAPLWQQAFDWFREKHDFDLCWKPMSMVGITCYYDIEIHHPKYVWDVPPKVTGKTYQEARQACIEKLIGLNN